jgi:sugar phosphate isomerase/epimerase
MELCGYSYSFVRPLARGEVGLPEVIDFFRELGLRRVELADPQVDSGEIAPLRHRLDDAGIGVDCYDVYTEFGRRDPAFRRAQLDAAERAFDRAVALGAAAALVLPGATEEGVAMDTARGWYVEALQACRPLARGRGLGLLAANLGSQAALCGTSRQLRDLARSVGPDLGLVFDVGNFLMAGESPLAALDRIGDLVAHVHLKDWRIEAPRADCAAGGGFRGRDGRCFVSVALGAGEVPLGAAIERLRHRGYRGALAIEYEGDGDPWTALRRGVAFARTCLAGPVAPLSGGDNLAAP